MKRNINVFPYKKFVTGLLSVSIISSSIPAVDVFAKEDEMLVGNLSGINKLDNIATIDDLVHLLNTSTVMTTQLYSANKYTGTETESTKFNFENKLKLKVTPTSGTIDGTTANLYINDILVGTQTATLNNLITFEYELSKLTTLTAGTYPLKIVFTNNSGGSNVTENLGDINIEAIDIQPIFNVSKNYDATTKVTNVTATKFTCADSNINVDGAITATFDVDTSSKDKGDYTMSSGQLTISNVRLVGDRSNHFKLTNNVGSTSNSSSVKINPQPLSISDQSVAVVNNKVFDKTVNATLSSIDVKFNGLPASEQFVKDVDYEVSSSVFEDPWVGNNKPVHTTIRFKSNKINNYTFEGSYEIMSTANITPSNFTDFKGFVLTKNYNSAETKEFDFNDLLVVSIQLDKITKTRNSLPSETFQIYIGNTPITTKTSMSAPDKQQYRIEAHLSELVNLTEGSYPVKVVYGGDKSTSKGEMSLGNINISAVEIVPYLTQTIEKAYDGKTTSSMSTSSFSKVATANSPSTYNSSVDANSNKNMWGGTYSSEVGVIATFDVVSSNKDVGNYSSTNSGVSITNWRLDGVRKNHYKLSNNNSNQNINLSIKKKDVTPEVVISDKKYDGKTDATVSNVIFKGAVEGETFLKGVDYNIISSNFNDASIGKNKDVTSDVQFITNVNNNTLRNYNVLGSNKIVSKGNIIKADGEITNQNILNSKGVACREFDFDDIIRVTGTPKARSTKYNKVEVYIDDVKVSTVDCKLDNTFTTDISLDEFDDISHGKNNVRVVWTGDGTNDSIEADYGDITLNPIPIEVEFSDSVEYDGNRTFTITTEDVKDKDNNKSLDLKVKADVKIKSEDVGKQDITSVSNVKITGDLAERYSLDSDDASGKIEVTKRSIRPSSARVIEEDGKLKVTRVVFKGLAEDEVLTIDKDFTAKAEYENNSKEKVEVKIELKNTTVASNYILSTTSIKEDLNNTIEEEQVLNNKHLFTDLESHWSEPAVAYLNSLGIINGYPDGTFKPNNYITRGDMAVISERAISNLNHKLSTSNKVKFEDVKENQYYYNSIQKLVSTQLFNGYPDGTFKPDNFITREESFVVIGKFIDKYCSNLPTKNNTVKYKDYNDVAEWARPYLDKLNKYGIVNGDTNGKVNPKDKVTRAEICQMLYNILTNNNK